MHLVFAPASIYRDSAFIMIAHFICHVLRYMRRLELWPAIPFKSNSARLWYVISVFCYFLSIQLSHWEILARTCCCRFSISVECFLFDNRARLNLDATLVPNNWHDCLREKDIVATLVSLWYILCLMWYLLNTRKLRLMDVLRGIQFDKCDKPWSCTVEWSHGRLHCVRVML